MKLSLITKLSLAAAAATLAASAHAQLVDQGTTFGQSTVSSALNGYSPGRYMKWNGGAQFQAYCIDPYTGGPLANSSYEVMSLDAFTTGTNSGYAQQIGRTSYNTFGLSASGQTQVRNDIQELFSWAYTDAATTGNTAKAAAFGLVLWEIVMQNWGTNGNSYSRTSGTFTTSGRNSTNGDFTSVADTATFAQKTTAAGTSNDQVEFWVQQYLSALNGTATWTSVTGATSAASWVYTVYFDNTPASQTFIRVTPQGVPAPATLALVGLGLVGVAVARRRKARA